MLRSFPGSTWQQKPGGKPYNRIPEFVQESCLKRDPNCSPVANSVPSATHAIPIEPLRLCEAENPIDLEKHTHTYGVRKNIEASSVLLKHVNKNTRQANNLLLYQIYFIHCL